MNYGVIFKSFNFMIEMNVNQMSKTRKILLIEHTHTLSYWRYFKDKIKVLNFDDILMNGKIWV